MKKITDTIAPIDNIVFQIGEYTVSKFLKNKEYPIGGYWVQRIDGEGMAVQADDFEQMIDAWFKETF